MNNIPFNRPFITGDEIKNITQVIESRKLSGNGYFTKKCQEFFETKYGFRKTLLTTSCTDALEMCAILAGIKEGDEVIVPSYTFVSTALAFVRQNAKIVFADSSKENPNIDVDKLEALITPNTKAIVPVHYAGVACDMDKIMELANKYNLIVIEDAAQSIDSFYKGKPLGSIGHLSAFSFHETKNINCGEGGLLVINDDKYIKRAEIIWEKGTNRAEFFRGEINKYGWVDTGSSFLPSEMNAAFLLAQLENLDMIQSRRKEIWKLYYRNLESLVLKGIINIPQLPAYSTNNGHMFYFTCRNIEERSSLIAYLKSNNVQSVFHYISLHLSDFYKLDHDGRELMNCDRYSDCLIRLPLFRDLKDEDVVEISNLIYKFYSN
ncbi:MAG: dTDP-4-amino-4,6-dideoxygalactose transaminase [Lachnospiraceae bacterium]|nr:dTDP-4-amino-4,6-dideoxygalactose transaminase [Lachnospiraceae bacterium]